MTVRPPDKANGGPPGPPLLTDSAAAKQPEVMLRVQRAERFGRPSNFSLSRAELARHVRQLHRSGWQCWEIRTRFGRWAA